MGVGRHGPRGGVSLGGFTFFCLQHFSQERSERASRTESLFVQPSGLLAPPSEVNHGMDGWLVFCWKTKNSPFFSFYQVISPALSRRGGMSREIGRAWLNKRNGGRKSIAATMLCFLPNLLFGSFSHLRTPSSSSPPPLLVVVPSPSVYSYVDELAVGREALPLSLEGLWVVFSGCVPAKCISRTCKHGCRVVRNANIPLL